MICIGPICVPLYPLLGVIGLALFNLRYYFVLLLSKIFGFAAPAPAPSSSASSLPDQPDEKRIAAITQVGNACACAARC